MPKVITNKIAKGIREARSSGMRYRDIAILFDVSMVTARRYATDANAIKLRQYERSRYLRDRQNPEIVERERRRAREYQRVLRAEQRNSDQTTKGEIR